MEPELSVKNYYEQLNLFLQETKTHLEKNLNIWDFENIGINELDEYILALNTFYYQTFHEHFFPKYKQLIHNDIYELYNLSQDENALKKNIITSFKNYAYLYNQLQNTLAQLQEIEQQLNIALNNIEQNIINKNLKSYFTLKQVVNKMNFLEQFLIDWQNTWQDNTLTIIQQNFPGHLSLLPVIQSLDPANKRHTRALNLFKTHLKLFIATLNKLSKDNFSKEVFVAQLRNLKSNAPQFNDKKIPLKLRVWYERYFSYHINHFLQLINYYIVDKKNEALLKLLAEMTHWLNSLDQALEKLIYHRDNAQGSEWSYLLLADTKQENVEKIKTTTHNFRTQLEKLLQEFNPEWDFAYTNYSAQAAQLIDEIDAGYSNIMTEQVIIHYRPFYEALKDLQLELTLAGLGLEELEAQEKQQAALIAKYKELLHAVAENTDKLSVLKITLEKNLAPRNAIRSYKNFHLHIEQYALRPGQVFPLNYNYLLQQKGLIDANAVDQEFIINSAQGDLFIIRLDDLTAVELPPISI